MPSAGWGAAGPRPLPGLIALAYQRVDPAEWRSGRDSNPRYAFDVYSLSRRAPSTTRPPLHSAGAVPLSEGEGFRKTLPLWQGCTMKYCAILACALLALAAGAPMPFLAGAADGQRPSAKAPTLAEIVAAAPSGDWQRVDPQDLVLIDLADGSRAALALAPAFAPLHVANIRAL